jgi:succinate dehydrogenase/fumarate reductase flavoprotein subunit
LRVIAEAGLRPRTTVDVNYREIVAAVKNQVLPYELNYLRHGDRLRPALQILHDTWSALRDGLGATGEEVFRAREAAAMVAHGRWMYHAALQRTESRGMHKRSDHPAQDPAQRSRLLTGGLDEIWSRQESAPSTRAGGGRAA